MNIRRRLNDVYLNTYACLNFDSYEINGSSKRNGATMSFLKPFLCVEKYPCFCLFEWLQYIVQREKCFKVVLKSKIRDKHINF